MAHPRFTHAIAGALSMMLLNCASERRADTASPSAPPKQAVVIEDPYAEDESRMTPAAGSTLPKEDSVEAASPALLSDSQIAAISDAVNTAELEEARIALDRTQDPRIRNFAQMMIDHHGEARRQQAELLTKLNMTTVESPQAIELRSDATDALTALRAADDAVFDRTYIDSQVGAHQKVLNLLDSDLIPAASQPELKALLQQLRSRVEEHLNQARDLQQRLQAPPPPGATGTIGETPNY